MKIHINIRLNDEEYQVARRLADDLFEGRLSQAIRFIIRSYAKNKQGFLRSGRPTEDEVEIALQESLV